MDCLALIPELFLEMLQAQKRIMLNKAMAMVLETDLNRDVIS